ncbi:MAG: O-antigen ligase family protein [Pyrinomonadaceae bacterium]
MNKTLNALETSQIRYADWLAPILAFALMALLFPFPGARMPSSQPWRAELLTTLFLMVGVIVLYLRGRESLSQMFTFEQRWVKVIFICFAAFTVWGLLSAFWAQSAYSAGHHTLVWIEYILFFLFVRLIIAQMQSIRFVTGVFLWLCGIIGILCIIDYATLPDFKALEGVLRARYSSYAELLVTGLPLVWITTVYLKKKKPFYIVMLIAAAGWTAAMLSLSKGVFIAGVIGFLFTFIGSLIFGLRRFRSRIFVSAAIWLVLTLSVQIGFSLLTPIPSTVDYISGKADATRETSTARIFVWKVGKQMAADHWLLGVGADNFGISFNESRAAYRLAHPADPKDETVSDNIVARAHNEPLQIFAELGIVGIVLLLIPLGLFSFKLFQAFLVKGFRVSPILWAALGGMSAFAVSSMVSSFSLRLVQSGIVFFIVFAVAVNEIVKSHKVRADIQNLEIPSKMSVVPVLLFGILLAMLTTHSLKAAAEYYVFKADRASDTESALKLYYRAVSLDPDYAAAYLRGSGRSYVEKDFAGCAKQLRTAINQGLGVVITYSALAECETKMGDMAAAERTFKKALKIFPRSVFLRVRYALFLNDEGRSDDSAKEISTARTIDSRQTDGWLNLITIGSVRAFYAAQTNPNLAPPAELLPADAVLQYLDPPPGAETKNP